MSAYTQFIENYVLCGCNLMNYLRQKTVSTPRGAHPGCNIPAPQGEGLGVGSVTSTPRDCFHTQSAENVILEELLNFEFLIFNFSSLIFKYPTPAPPLKGRGYAHQPFAHVNLTQRIEHSWRLIH